MSDEKTDAAVPRGNYCKPITIVVLDSAEEEICKALGDSGFLGDFMLTLLVPLGDSGSGWDESMFKKVVGSMMRAYYKKYSVMLQYQMVMNRGYFGSGNLSCHIVWKHELPLKPKFLCDWWEKRFGIDRAKVSWHSEGLRYFCKNMGQQDAMTHDGPHNRALVPTKKRWRHRGR